jgi:hypothetical protein
MHSPGVCGVILAAGSQAGTGDTRSKTNADAVAELIDALSADTEMVLVGVPATDADALAPVVWGRAAYMVLLPETANDADTLRVMLQEVLNRGRDAALVTVCEPGVMDVAVTGTSSSTAQPRIQSLTAQTAHRMVAEYCASGDEIWALVPETEMLQGHPVLMGRRMIELFLRGQKWSAADEILSANLEHVRTIKLVELQAGVEPLGSATSWKAPWD